MFLVELETDVHSCEKCGRPMRQGTQAVVLFNPKDPERRWARFAHRKSECSGDLSA